MAARTGRKTVADKAVQAKAVQIKKSNPQLSNSEIAQRLGVTPRQIQYWLSKAKTAEGK